jgi:hypothetical protein
VRLEELDVLLHGLELGGERLVRARLLEERLLEDVGLRLVEGDGDRVENTTGPSPEPAVLSFDPPSSSPRPNSAQITTTATMIPRNGAYRSSFLAPLRSLRAVGSIRSYLAGDG